MSKITPWISQGSPALVVDRVGLLEHPVDRSVLVDHPVLVDEGLVLVVRVPVLVPRAVDVIGMDVVPPRVRVGQPFVLTDAEQLDDLRAHVDRFRVLIHRVQVDDGGDVLHQRPVLRLCLEARGPAGLQLRAVPKGEDQQAAWRPRSCRCAPPPGVRSRPRACMSFRTTSPPACIERSVESSRSPDARGARPGRSR